MGRFPLLTQLNRYLLEMASFKSKSTLANEKRMLRHIHDELQELKSQNRIDTVNPEKISEKEIQELMKLWKEKGNDVNTITKKLQYLNNLLVFAGNPVIANMKQTRKNLFPRANNNKEIITLSIDEVEKILESTYDLDGWDGIVIRFALHFYYFTGLRPGELRLAGIGDIDTTKWRFTVTIPKGKGSWGCERTITVPPPLRPIVLEYLEQREIRLKEKDLKDNPYLIPNLSNNQYKNHLGKEYSSNTFRKLKRLVEDASGIKFEIRTLRRTNGQHLIDQGIPIEYISVNLGHSTTKTTETYYARVKSESTYDLINGAWENRSSAKTRKLKMSQ